MGRDHGFRALPDRRAVTPGAGPRGNESYPPWQGGPRGGSPGGLLLQERRVAASRAGARIAALLCLALLGSCRPGEGNSLPETIVLQATADSPNVVSLRWSASTAAGTDYRILRDGHYITGLIGLNTLFIDYFATPATRFCYEVQVVIWPTDYTAGRSNQACVTTQAVEAGWQFETVAAIGVRGGGPALAPTLATSLPTVPISPMRAMLAVPGRRLSSRGTPTWDRRPPWPSTPVAGRTSSTSPGAGSGPVPTPRGRGASPSCPLVGCPRSRSMAASSTWPT